MSTIDANKAIPANRPLIGAKPAAASVAASSTPSMAADHQTSRFQDQQRYAANMWKSMGNDARLAAVMFNPIFMVQSQAITSAAVAEAVRRYETEVPQQDFSVLYAQEMGKARQAILAMPGNYAKYGEAALEATGDALLGAYNTTADAVGTAATATANAVSNAATATATAVNDAAVTTGRAARTGALTVLGAFALAGKAFFHGIGHVLHGIGNVFTGAGGRLERVGN